MDDHFIEKVIFSDEIYFYLGRYENTDLRLGNPHEVYEKWLLPQKVSVYGAFWFGGIMKPFFSKVWPVMR